MVNLSITLYIFFIHIHSFLHYMALHVFIVHLVQYVTLCINIPENNIESNILHFFPSY